MHTRFSIVAGALAGALLALSGCHHRAPANPVTATPPGLVISQARLVLPAVKGHPGAAYFTLGNESGVAATLVRIDIAGAQKTEMHQTVGGAMTPLAQVRIDPGQRVIFSPAGRHVMVFGMAPSLMLSPGGSSAIGFHFQDGKSISAPLRIEGAGGTGGTGGMAGMTMGSKP